MYFDFFLMEVIKECYVNVDYWSIRRQILFVVVDKMSFKEIKIWILDLLRYCYNVVRYYCLFYGRGVVVFIFILFRMYVELEKFDYFFFFIISIYIVQDLLFGEKLLKLLLSEVIKVFNVIRLIILEYIIKQYKGYCCELGFILMSCFMLCCILNVCLVIVCKLL